MIESEKMEEMKELKNQITQDLGANMAKIWGKKII